MGGGPTLAALVARRARDELGLAVAAAGNGTRYVRTLGALGTRPAGETVVELTYLAQIREWMTVQPDVQCVLHP